MSSVRISMRRLAYSPTVYPKPRRAEPADLGFWQILSRPRHDRNDPDQRGSFKHERLSPTFLRSANTIGARKQLIVFSPSTWYVLFLLYLFHAFHRLQKILPLPGQLDKLLAHDTVIGPNVPYPVTVELVDDVRGEHFMVNHDLYTLKEPHVSYGRWHFLICRPICRIAPLTHGRRFR